MRRMILSLLTLTLSLPLMAADSIGARFVAAIESSDLAAVKVLIEREGVDVDTPIDDGGRVVTPLLKAASDGELPIVQYLLSKNAAVNAQAGDSGETPLISAATRGHADVVRTLLGAKADIELRNASDFNAFSVAVASGNQEIAALLLTAGANIEDGPDQRTPLALAAAEGKPEMIRFLASHGADVNHGAKKGARTPLMSAVIGGQIESVRTLIDLRANLNAKMKDGTTSLKLAIGANRQDIVATLQQAGARQ